MPGPENVPVCPEPAVTHVSGTLDRQPPVCRLTRPNRGINTLPWLVRVLIVKGMRTAREQKEASTVHNDRDKANMSESQRRHAQRAANYPWSLPSRVAMSFCLGMSYALGIGQVPV